MIKNIIYVFYKKICKKTKSIFLSLLIYLKMISFISKESLRKKIKIIDKTNLSEIFKICR